MGALYHLGGAAVILNLKMAKELYKFFSIKGFNLILVVVGDDIFDKAQLSFDDPVDLLFNGVTRDHLEDLNAAMLPDPVAPVGRLILFCRIPPPIVVDNYGSGGQINSDSGGFEGGDKHLALGVGLKPVYFFFPVAGRSANGGIFDFFFS